MKNYIYSVYAAIKEEKGNRRFASGGEFEKSRIEAEIVRNVHSIEKGLSIKDPRLGFGVKKINEMFSLVERYLEISRDFEALYFVVDAVKEYVAYHEKSGFENQDINEIRKKNDLLEDRIGAHEGKCGGTLKLDKSDLEIDASSVEKLLTSRHSVRDFSGEPVPEELLMRAIELAQRVPSACNRQAVRVYSISAENYIKVVGALDGIGGFAQDADRFLLITGVQSAYRRGEKNQFVVSAAMFAAYLTVSLHALGIGACTVQHPLVPTETFEKMREAYSIPRDEQTVVTLAIGMMNDSTTVPVSRRYSLGKIYKNLN